MFLAYLVQKQEGCDYTIGCGACLIQLESQDYEAAVSELRGIVTDLEGGFWGDAALATATIIKVEMVALMLVDQWYAGVLEEAEDE